MAQKEIYRYQSSMAIKDSPSTPTYRIINATRVLGQIDLEPDGYVFYPRNGVGLSIGDLPHIISLIALAEGDISED